MDDNGGGGGGGGGRGSKGTGGENNQVDAPPTGGNPVTKSESCEDLKISTPLLSPNARVISRLPPGQWLNVELRSVDGQDTAVAVAPQPQGGERDAGSIGSSSLAKLVKCLREGQVFYARIEPDAIVGSCKVLVCHANRLPS